MGIAAGLLLLVVITVLVVTVFVDPNRFKGRIEAAVTEATGQPFRIAGDVHIAWFPWLALQTGPADFGRSARAQEPPLVRWQSARVGARLVPLIRGELLIDGIRLDSPQFYVRRSADGRTNWGDLAAAIKGRTTAASGNIGEDTTEAAGQAAARGPRIGGVQIRNGALTYIDERAGVRVAIAGWHLNVGEWKTNSTFPVQTRLTLHVHAAPPAAAASGAASAKAQAAGRARATPVSAASRLPSDVLLDLAARLHISEDANDIDVFGLKLSSRVRGGTLPAQGVPVALQVSRLAARLSPLDVAISEVSGRIGDAHLTASVQAGETGSARAPYIRGPLSLQVPSVRNLLATFGIDVPLPLDKTTLGAMQLTSVWEWQAGALAASSIELALDETRFTGELTRSSTPEHVWTFSLHGDRIGLGRYVAIEDKSKEPFVLPVAALKALQVQGELTFDQAWLAQAQMKNVRLRLELADGIVKTAQQ